MSWCKLSLCVLAVLVVGKTHAGKLVCNYDGDAYFRDGPAKVSSEDLKPAANICDQIIWGHYGIDPNDFDIETIGKSDSDTGKVHIRAVTALKKIKSNLKVLLSIGGNADTENVEKYLELLEKPKRRTDFVNSVAKRMVDYGFDGVNLAWQFPPVKEPKEHGFFGSIWSSVKHTFKGEKDDKPEVHREQFTALARELKAVLRPHNAPLSITVLPHVNASVYYDVVGLKDIVDQWILQTCDYRTPKRTPEQADYSAPLYFQQGRIPHQNVEATVQQWIQRGATPDKLIITVPTHARTWKMTDDSGKTGTPPVKVDGEGKEGTYTKTKGILAYYECCPNFAGPNAKADGILLRKVPDPNKRSGNYAYRLPEKDKGIWISYEDPEMASAKALFARNKGLLGVAIQDLSMDDFKGMCDGTPFPITRAVRNSL